jgi:hypothetical protein
VPRKDIQTQSHGNSRVVVAIVLVALLIVGFASLYMVRMPGNLSSMIASMFPF